MTKPLHTNPNAQAVKELKTTGRLTKATRLQLQTIIKKGVK